MARVGVLALQGDFAAHVRVFRRTAGVEACDVRHVDDLDALDGLVIPGGESTTLLNLMRDEPWFDALREFHDRGGALFGTCAGAILLSREVENPAQPSLGLLDATIRRNGFGRQVDSFESEIGVVGLGLHSPQPRWPAVAPRRPRRPGRADHDPMEKQRNTPASRS